MVQSDNPFAKNVLAKYSENSEFAGYDLDRNVLLVMDLETQQPHMFSPSIFSSYSPDFDAKYRDARIVAKVPQAVTFAATNQPDDSVTLFVFTYKHSGIVCGLSPEEFAAWQSNGFWNTYVKEHEDPVESRRRNWSDHEEPRYQKLLSR